MSKQATKALIDEKITGNGVQAITGPILNNVLNTMVDDYGTQEELSQLSQEVSGLLTFTLGQISPSTGNPDPSTNRAYSELINNPGAIVIKDSSVSVSFRYYGADGTYIGSSGTWSSGSVVSTDTTKAKMRVVVKYSNDATISDASVFNSKVFAKSVYTELEDNKDGIETLESEQKNNEELFARLKMEDESLNSDTIDLVNVTGIENTASLRAFDVTPQTWLSGYYSGSLADSDFHSTSSYKSTIVAVKSGMVVRVSGKSNGNNYRVFNNAGVEILNSGSAYFTGATNGDFTMPNGATYFSVVYSVSSESHPENIRIYRCYYIKDSATSFKSPILVYGMRPNDGETAFESKTDLALICYCIPVGEGDRIRYSATNSVAKSIRFCFSQYLPYDGCPLTNADYKSEKDVKIEAIAPYNGYFVAYHHSDYFSDQVFQCRSQFFNGAIVMEGGNIVSGNTPAVTDARVNFVNHYRTPLFIKARKILPVALGTNETIKVVCYDGQFNYISETQNGVTAPGTEYVKIVISNTNGFLGGRTIEVVGINDTGAFEQAKNQNRTSTKTNTISFSFEVQMPEDGEEPGVVNERHFDNGAIRLPVNYDPNGEPVPLAVFWHGTGGFRFLSPGLSYPNQMLFLLQNGFAVCDCSGMTDKYQLGEDAVDGWDCRFNPLAISCFCGLYDYVVRNYNVRKDGAFVFGKSNGGLGAAWLASMKPFPIKAAASLAGSLSVPESMRFSTVDNLNYWCARFGMTGYTFNYTGYYFTNETEQGNDFIISNVDKYRMYDPMVLMSSVDASSLVTEAFETGYQNQDTAGMWAIINQGRKIMPSPIKIFHAVDDTDVPIVISRFFKKLVDNTNGVCVLREIPAGYGGHHAVDNSALAPMVTVETKYAGQQTIVQTYAELVEWFRRWM